MLENLDNIDWANIRTQFSQESHKVPEHLRALADAALDGFDWRKPFREIDKHIRYDESEAEATPYIIPFLIEILAIDKAPDHLRWEILQTLSIWSGDEYEWRLSLASKGPYYKLAADIHLAIVSGVEIYLELLNHPNERIRDGAYELLFMGHKPDVALAFGPALLKYLQRAPVDNFYRNRLILFQKYLAEQRQHFPNTLERYAPWLETIAQSELPDQTPIVALCAIITVFGASAPPPVISALLERLIQFHADSELYPVLRDLIAESTGLMNQRLYTGFHKYMMDNVKTSALAQEYARFLLQILPKRAGFNIYRRHIRVAQGASDIRYSQDSAQTVNAQEIKALTPDQVYAVQAVLNADRVWDTPHNLMEMIGFPADRDAARNLLAKYTRNE